MVIKTLICTIIIFLLNMLFIVCAMFFSAGLNNNKKIFKRPNMLQHNEILVFFYNIFKAFFAPKPHCVAWNVLFLFLFDVLLFVLCMKSAYLYLCIILKLYSLCLSLFSIKTLVFLNLFYFIFFLCKIQNLTFDII